MKTNENLMAAFAGESQANRKYTAFAAVAEAAGHMDAARLFRAAAEAENIHAQGELKAAGKVGDTTANLKAAIEGETYEFTTMYPEFLKVAEEEGQKQAAMVFHGAMEAEKCHATLYKDVLDNLGKDTGAAYMLCPICGYIEKGDAPESCPVCKAKGSTFKKY